MRALPAISGHQLVRRTHPTKNFFLVPKLLLGNPLALEALLRSKPGALKSGSAVAKQELGVQVRSQAGAWERDTSQPQDKGGQGPPYMSLAGETPALRLI
jgi:hypothetical protein